MNPQQPSPRQEALWLVNSLIYLLGGSVQLIWRIKVYYQEMILKKCQNTLNGCLK
jgi:hypothetical protein